MMRARAGKQVGVCVWGGMCIYVCMCVAFRQTFSFHLCTYEDSFACLEYIGLFLSVCILKVCKYAWVYVCHIRIFDERFLFHTCKHIYHVHSYIQPQIYNSYTSDTAVAKSKKEINESNVRKKSLVQVPKFAIVRIWIFMSAFEEEPAACPVYAQRSRSVNDIYISFTLSI